MNKIYCIYHSADNDGKCSAAIVRYFESKANPKNEIIFFGSSYEPEPSFMKDIEHGSKVYLVDISLSAENMKYLKDNCKPIWIDHHISAITDSEKNGYSDMKGLRRVGTAGCELTWEYFTNDSENLPYIVKMLGRFDVWDMSYSPVTFHINTYLDYFDLKPIPENVKIWEQLFDIFDSQDIKSEEEVNYQNLDKRFLVETIYEEGKKLFNYCLFLWAKDSKGKSFNIELSWNGKKYKGIAANGGKGSTYFDAVKKPEHDFFMTFSISKDRNIYYGLYSDKEESDLDLSQVAKKLLGPSSGGHKNASGGCTELLPWQLKGIEVIESTSV